MDILTIIWWILGLGLGIFGIYGLAKKTGGPESRRAYTLLGAILLIAGIFIVLFNIGILEAIGLGGGTLATGLPSGACSAGAEQCVGNNLYKCVNQQWISGGQVVGKCGVGARASTEPYQPTAAYSTVNHWNSSEVTGTSYYKSGDSKATTTAITNTNPSTSYKYWVSNADYYVKPLIFSGGGTKTLVNNEAYANGSITITGYDLIESTAISGSQNLSLSSGTAKAKYTVLGSGSTVALPFGGALVVEVNTTVTTVACSGEGISSTPSTDYQVTYSPTYTTHKHVVYEIGDRYDISPNGIQGVTKTFDCDFIGTDPGTDSPYILTFIPANYYYVNDIGDIVLDVEEKLNGLTTRTGISEWTFTGYWE